MSIGTIISFICGLGLFIYSIITGGASDPWVFLHFNSILMVLGGTIAATFIAYKDIYVFKALAGMINIFKHLDINSKTLYDDVGKSSIEQVMKQYKKYWKYKMGGKLYTC